MEDVSTIVPIQLAATTPHVLLVILLMMMAAVAHVSFNMPGVMYSSLLIVITGSPPDSGNDEVSDCNQ